MRAHLRYVLPLTVLMALLGTFAYQPASSSDTAKPSTDLITILISDELRGWYEGCG